MDTTLLMNAGVTSSGVALILIMYRVFKVMNGKKIVSSCCGKKSEIGFQVGDMTPVIVNPIEKRIVSVRETQPEIEPCKA